MFRRVFLFFLLIALALPAALPFPVCAQDSKATLFISPSSGTYGVGKTFTVNVSVNSGGGVGINAAEGTINFDSAKLTVTALSNAGSIFSLWTTDPTYSNADGRITFGGGAPGPYKGSAGKIFSVTFKTKAPGVAAATFSAGIVLAADGKGTNVFGGFGNASYTIEEADEPEPQKPTENVPPRQETTSDQPKGLLPPLPEIESDTHLEEDVWYSNNDPVFSWKLLADLNGVSYLIDQEAETDPGNTPDGIVETMNFEDVPDGENYFHIKYQNRSGWGQSAHRKFLVDVTPPENFNIILDNGGDATNPSPKISFKTSDKASGIKHYALYTNGMRQELDEKSAQTGVFTFLPLAPGEYNIEIIAYDMAENGATSTIKFMVDPLKAPIITAIPKLINKKDELIIRGTSFYSNVTVKVYIGLTGKDPITENVQTDDAGNWSYFHRGGLDKGNYEVWAKIIDERGAQSLDSTKHLLSVVAPSIVDEYGLFIIIFLLVLIVLLLLYIFYITNRCKEEKARVMRETIEVKEKLGKIFNALREEVDELIVLADKKPGLSESERRVKEKLQESLDISEEFITKEISDVEKEIKLPKKDEK